MASGNPSAPHGLNTEGLRRRGFDAATIARLKRAYRTLYRAELTLQQARERLEAELAALAGPGAADGAPAAARSIAADGAPAGAGPIAAHGASAGAGAGAGLAGAALGERDALRLLTDFLARVERGIVR
jgi:hypothetical protein